MKVVVLLILYLIVSFHSSLHAQSRHWVQANNGTTEQEGILTFAGHDTLYCGGSETLRWSTDGGMDWMIAPFQYLGAPEFLDSRNGRFLYISRRLIVFVYLCILAKLQI